MKNDIIYFMKFKLTPYHSNLFKDKERLSGFYEGILEYAEYFDDLKNDEGLINKVVYDLGCGSGVLTYFAALYFQGIIGFEKESKISSYADENLKDYDNVLIINEDVLNLEGLNKADILICEMLDTALIDEEEVLALNHFLDFKEDNAIVIPKEVVNFAEPLNMDRFNICWEDNDSKPNYEILGPSIIYSQIDLNERIDEDFTTNIELTFYKNGIFNGIKITTVTLITDNIVLGPTPMFNPPLLIPVEEVNVSKGDIINLKLSYKMGGGIESIETLII